MSTVYDTTAALPARPRRLRPQPAACALAGRPRIAVQFVLNYEEGGENACCTATRLRAVPVRDVQPGGLPRAAHEHGRHLRVRLARRRVALLREFEKRGLPLTVFGVSMALQRHPELTQAFKELGHEIACHG
jgi:allantoinase